MFPISDIEINSNEGRTVITQANDILHHRPLEILENPNYCLFGYHYY